MAVEEIKPYTSDAAKAAQVEKMFDNIASSYDFMNHAMSFGLDRVWRNRAVSLLKDELGGKTSGLKILDVACGTGDVTFHISKEFSHSHVDGVDLSEGMLRQARAKQEAEKNRDFYGRVSFRAADCLDLPFPDESYDVVTVAYGVRNFENLKKGFSEMFRVLKKGGIICVLELCVPRNFIAKTGYKIYTRGLIPLVGRLVSGDRKAYSYLLDSIQRCPDRQKMTSMMSEVGFENERYKTLFPDTVAVYTAHKK